MPDDYVAGTPDGEGFPPLNPGKIDRIVIWDEAEGHVIYDSWDDPESLPPGPGEDFTVTWDAEAFTIESATEEEE